MLAFESLGLALGVGVPSLSHEVATQQAASTPSLAVLSCFHS